MKAVSTTNYTNGTNLKLRAMKQSNVGIHEKQDLLLVPMPLAILLLIFIRGIRAIRGFLSS